MLLPKEMYSQRQLEAARIDEKIEVDGFLDESGWETATTTQGFTTWQPTPGDTANTDASIKMLYDDEAFYLGVFIEEVSRDSIMQELTLRDEVGNTDWFGFFLDTYQANNNALEFIVLSTGVQFDAKLVENQGEDRDWDSVWFSEVRLTDSGWFLEIKIPYSAIRFPKKDIQHWNINFIKYQARTGEKSVWNPIEPTGTYFLNQSGRINGIENIKPPVRLSFSPYLSAYYLRSKDNNREPVFSNGYSYNGGLDLKYGINDAYTLDMTVIPDFGQVQSDDNIVNLSPFEIRFNENRPFFTEGVEIFNKGDLFYSRRVGGTPIRMYDVEDQLDGVEIIIDNPSETQLLNATKISGRGKKGLGVGVFNAVSAETNATILNEETDEERKFVTAPLTNYNLVVLDQNLKNNSTVSFTNANVWRKGGEFYDANNSAVTFNLKNKEQSWALIGDYAMSQKYISQEEDIFGHRYSIGIDKLTGNFVFGAWHEAKTREFDSNDLGFNRRSNLFEFGVWANYSIFEEFWGKFNRANFWFNYNHVYLFEPMVHTSDYINFGFWTQAKNLWEYNMWFNVIPKDDDYFEPRTDGYFIDVPLNYNGGYWMGTDGRKQLRLSGSIYGYNVDEEGRHGWGSNVNVRYRFNNKLSSSIRVSKNTFTNSYGWVDFDEYDVPVFGRRDQRTITNVLSTNYTFSDKMGITLRLRHYWIKVLYDSFYQLDTEGLFYSTDYNIDQDFNFDLVNLDLNYRWRFAPGSDLFINWKGNIAGSYLDTDTTLDELSYFNGVTTLGRLPQENSFSVRIVYFLDYLDIQKTILQ